jgi:hypothetical protein
VTVWAERDLPVLRALDVSDDVNIREGFLSLGDLDAREALGLELGNADVYDAMLVLRDAAYIDFELKHETGPGALFTRVAVTGRGQQALGQWPLFDSLAAPETIALLLERLAEEASTEEEASNLRRAAGYMRTLSLAAVRAFAASAISTLVRGSLGIP